MEMTTSASAVIVIRLSLVLITMLFPAVLSTISMRSSRSVSTSRITCPLREVIARMSLWPSPLVTGGLSLPFHSAPTT